MLNVGFLRPKHYWESSLNDQLSYDGAKVKVSPLNKHTKTR